MYWINIFLSGSDLLGLEITNVIISFFLVICWQNALHIQLPSIMFSYWRIVFHQFQMVLFVDLICLLNLLLGWFLILQTPPYYWCLYGCLVVFAGQILAQLMLVKFLDLVITTLIHSTMYCYLWGSHWIFLLLEDLLDYAWHLYILK